MDEQKQIDDALFAALNKEKKKKRLRRLRTTLIIIGIIALVLVLAVLYLKGRVQDAIARQSEAVLSCSVEFGSISTTVSGSGAITDVDAEKITVPSGVEIEEILVDPNSRVKKGDVLATVDMATVMTALADVQSQIDAKDKELSDISSDSSSSYIRAGIAGRVKVIYAQPGDDVAACMIEHGALALISQDKYMSVSIPTDALSVGDSVSVLREDGSSLTGRVESSIRGNAVVLVTDKGTVPGEAVTVQSADGTVIGTGELAIHNPIKVVGYTGTVSSVLVKIDQNVSVNSNLFRLKDMSASASFSTILKERQELESILLSLLTIYSDGALRAPFDGTVLSLEDENTSPSVSTASPDLSSGLSYFSSFGSQVAGSYTQTAGSAGISSSSPASGSTEKTILTLAKDEQMSVTISVDESDILALEIGQQATLSIESIGKDTYSGVITEIDRTAAGGSGAASYSATVTFDKGDYMLAGMTADVMITISGTEDVLIIPTDALNRTSASAYVYTGYDEKTAQFLSPVTVSPGVSNKDWTEIRTGLNEGDTVFYTKESNPFWMYGFGMDGYGG